MIRSLGTTVTRALVDWHTGTIVETGASTYRPTAAVRRHVLLRDQHCRLPGSGVPPARSEPRRGRTGPAKFCDIDHVTP
ncbi:hypothetical protein [Leekyejoonella antrihumi]|uniref:HNH endonuclease n=1 Tax=Leekyejoonella antrihumi TaxID=1660198 RepID=A0A563E9N9_9MICO|nr:hypothetical protein [Leekyejoonella antrihumi]TWP38943.1 hypothetical protein FGL98_00650 [Leekyejoonella antrihumi]